MGHPANVASLKVACLTRRISLCVASCAQPGLSPFALKPFLGFRLIFEAGNVLLHAAGVGNDDVPSTAFLKRLGFKCDLIGGFGHPANMPSDWSRR